VEGHGYFDKRTGGSVVMIARRAVKIVAILLSAVGICAIVTHLVDRPSSASQASSAPSQTLVRGDESEPHPDLVFLEPSANLGSRKGVVDHRFHYRNDSSHRVVISSIRPGCACTLVQPERMVLEPGEESSFGIQVDLSKHPRGFKRFLVDVKYQVSDRDATDWRATLELVLMNDPDVYVTDNPVKLTGIAGDTVRSRFTLVDFREQPIKHLRLETKGTLQAQVVRQPDTYQPGWKWVVEVSAQTAHTQPGRYLESVLVEAEPPLPHPVQVEVEVNVLPRLYLKPNALVLSREHAVGNDVGRVVEVHDHRGERSGIEIGSIACANDAVVWTVTADQESRAPVLRVGLRDGATPPKEPVKLELKAVKPCSQELSLYVSFR
jgi:hypothetical protein